MFLFDSSGSHTELLKDPEGPYSQLIKLQEVNQESREAGIDKVKQESMSGSFRRYSKGASMPRSISRGSSGVGNSSRHSFSVSFGLAAGVPITDVPMADESASVDATERSAPVPLRRLAYLNKPEIPILVLGSVAAIVNGVILPLFGLLFANAIETFYKPPDKLKKDSKFWALIMMLLGIATLVAAPAKTYFFSVAGCKLIQRIRLLCFQKIVNMEVGWFDRTENSSGSIGARLSTNAATVRALVGDALSQLVENLASVTAGLVIAFASSWQLALIVLAMFPLLGLNGFVQMKFMKGFSADAKVEYKTK